MKKLALILAIALAAAAVLTGGWMMSRPAKEHPELTMLRSQLEKAEAEIARLNSELAKRPAVKLPAPTASPGSNGIISSAKAATEKAGTPTIGFAAASASDEKGSEGAARSLKKMLEAPGMKDLMKQQGLIQIEMIYGKLFERFQLTSEEKENFKQLLSARFAAQQDLGLKMMDSDLSAEQRKQFTGEYEAAKKASDASIQTFLSNEADYQAFQHWEDTQPERMQFEMMGGRSHFSSVGEPLSPEHEQQLIDIMAAERKAPSALPDLSKPENFSPENMTEEKVQQQLRNLDLQNQAIAQKAAAFLSPAQLQALSKLQQQTRTMAETGLKMSSAMFGKGK